MRRSFGEREPLAAGDDGSIQATEDDGCRSVTLLGSNDERIVWRVVLAR